MSDESERFLDDADIDLKGRIYGHAPVQAEGTICGKPFYFRAKYEQWEFSLAEDEEADPADICMPEQGFFREETYGKPRSYAASFMSYDEAEAFIKRCAREWLENRN